MKKKLNPTWITIEEVLAVHEKLIALFGGAIGTRDRPLLESALGRPVTFLSYDPKSDIFDIASTYAESLINNHPFVDGNKRTGFVAAILFIESNGYLFLGQEELVVSMTLGLADKSISREEYAGWLRNYSKKQNSNKD
jgi:death on curing protein